MKFEDIESSIMSYENSFEKTNGIFTLNVEVSYKEENCAVLLANKSDNSQTVFYARKDKRANDESWRWFCFSEIEISNGLPKLCEIYRFINQNNGKRRNTKS